MKLNWEDKHKLISYISYYHYYILYFHNYWYNQKMCICIKINILNNKYVISKNYVTIISNFLSQPSVPFLLHFFIFYYRERDRFDKFYYKSNLKWYYSNYLKNEGRNCLDLKGTKEFWSKTRSISTSLMFIIVFR